MSDEERRVALELRVAAARVGTSPHLVGLREFHTADEPRSLCGVVVTKRRGAWFAITGCKRCARAAMKQGLTTTVDIDAALIDLQDVLDGVVRD